MARHTKRRRRNNKFFAYPVEADLSLGALTVNTIIATALTNFGQTRVRCISADLTWALANATVSEGPIRVGLASLNLTVTEMAEKLDARPTSQTDVIAMERARRPVRDTGKFPNNADPEVLNDGKPIRTKLQFSVNEGVECAVWARNESQATLTTGAVVYVSGTLYMVWT